MSEYKSNIWKMYLFNFLMNLQFIGGVLVPFFLNWGKISFFQIMILQSFFVFSKFALEIPTGAIADHFGRKTSIFLGAVASGIGAFVYSSIPNYYIFFVGEFFWALGNALVSGAGEALIYDSLKEIKKEPESKKIFGRSGSFELLALMIAAPIGSIIASKFGLQYTMMFTGVFFLIGAIITLFIKEPKVRKEKKDAKKKYIDTLTEGINYFKNHKLLRTLTFDRVTTGALIFFIIWTYQPLLTELNFPLIYFGLVHAGICGIQILFMNKFEFLERIFQTKKNYLLWSGIITGIAFFLLGIIKFMPENKYIQISLSIFLMLTISGFGLSRQTLFQNYMNKHIESKYRATAISTVSMFYSLLTAILYPLVGLIAQWSLFYSVMIIGIGIISFTLISKIEEKHLID